MAPSMSPVFTVRALDVRPSSYSAGHDPTDFLHLRADAESSAAASSSSGGVSGTVVGLTVLLVLVTLGASAAAWYIIRQRKQILAMSTVRVLYNVDNLAQDSEAYRSGTLSDEKKVTTLDAATTGEDKMFTIDLSDNAKPRAIPIPPVPSEPSHALPSAMLRRKHSRNVARQRLRIIIPSGVAIPDVELVTTATVHTATPNTGRSSAVSAVRGGTLSRRNTARTPSRTPRSALSSAVSALSTAAVGIVHRRETVEPVYQSNGWAPATIVYLPKNPRDMAQQAAAPSPTVARKPTRKSIRRVPPPIIVPNTEKAVLVA